jgi:ribose/xylose/arabinose/galactoside ABC-type transport system permease subunit
MVSVPLVIPTGQCGRGRKQRQISDAKKSAQPSLQLGVLSILTMGLIPVLLIGEIDLSTGSVAGLCASVTAALQAHLGQAARGSIPAAPTASQADAGALRRGPTSRCDYRRIGITNSKLAPCGSFGVARTHPPCASTIERQIESPIPMPPGFVV